MILQLPSIFEEKQINSVVSILDRQVPVSARKGIQFIQSGHSSTSSTLPPNFKDAVKLVKDTVPRDYNLELHAPICPHEPSKDLNLAYSKSKNTLLYSVELAEAIGAGTLIVHSNTVYRASAKPQSPAWSVWQERYNDWKVMNKEIRDPLYVNLEDLARQTKVTIAIENMPVPISADKSLNPKDIHFDPNMVTFEDLIEFCDRTMGISNLKIVYDTSHALLTKKSLAMFADIGIRTTEDLLQTPYRGVYPEYADIFHQPSIDKEARAIYDKGKLASVQLASTGNTWIAGKQTSEEGIKLIGHNYDELLLIAKMTRDASPSIPLSLDILEYDYISRPNQSKALEKIVQDLYLS